MFQKPAADASIFPGSLFRSSGAGCGLGAKRRLTDIQLTQLEGLLDQGPPAHGFPTELWTSARHFGVRYHPDYVRRLLRRRLGWTSHKPQRRARQRNDKEVERWKGDEFPHVLREAWKRQAHVAFVDESRG